MARTCLAEPMKNSLPVPPPAPRPLSTADAQRPPLHGLVLAGGRSTRMGQDKSLLDYHGVPQRQYLADQLRPFCAEVWVSLGVDQVPLPGERVLADRNPDAGPLGGIRSAFAHLPTVAWLVVACDWSQIPAEILRFLIENRRPEYLATALRNPVDGTPEPLLTIWEPACAPVLEAAWQRGERSPRRLLGDMPTQLVEVPWPDALQNINTPGAYQRWHQRRTAF